MASIKVDFSKNMGKVKPMHATNNGPAVEMKYLKEGRLHPFNNNLYEFKEAGIPYARTHDSSFYHRYGQEHTVDVYYIFPNFDADPYDPKNYDFECTDQYLLGCELAGTEVFYRLGQRIEHEVKKYGIHPPKDFQKWAVICEHIIRHYTEGWANGFKMKMEYWEIWNEPDLHWNNGHVSPTWSGTKEQFFEFYHVAATHLKNCFPNLKIGGPALAGDLEWAEDFLAHLKAPLDFFSWHCYSHSVEKMVAKSQKVRELLDKYGFEKAESILNEWNYVLGWHGDDIVYSHEQRRKIKGASFSLAAMCACQNSSIDMLMYYDARPNEFWNGMFDDMVIGRVLKGYYPFPMFNTLYRLGNSVEALSDENTVYVGAAMNGERAAVVLTHFVDEESEAKDVSIELSGFGGESGTELEIYLLDDAHDLERIQTVVFFGDRFVFKKDVPNYTSYLFKLKRI